MSKISKETANAIAEKLTEKKRKEHDQVVDELRAFCLDLCKKKIPAPVMECYDKHKDYFRVISSVQCSGNGANHETINLGSKLPSWNNSWSVQLALNVENGKTFVKLINQRDRLQKQTEELHAEIKNALISLGTYNRIAVEFPEAAKLLPVRATMSLVVNVDKIRQKLK